MTRPKSEREFLYGRHAVREALLAGRRRFFRLLVVEDRPPPGDLVELASERRVAVERVPRRVLEALGEGHQGLALEAGPYPYLDLRQLLDLLDPQAEPPLILVLDAVQDPQNLGALLRTAEVVGVHGVLLPQRRSAGVTPAVVRTSAGASEHLPIARANLVQALRRLKAHGLWVVGLHHGPEARPVTAVDLSGPLALVVGSEGSGIRRLVRETCDLLVRLPMRGKVESLNAAVAGSVMLYQAWGARGYPQGPGFESADRS